MECHARLDDSVVLGRDRQHTLLVVEADSEAEVRLHDQISILLHNEVLGGRVYIFNASANLKPFYQIAECLISRHIGLLLVFCRVHE